MPTEKETIVEAGGHGDGKTEKVNRGGRFSDGLLFRWNVRRNPTGLSECRRKSDGMSFRTVVSIDQISAKKKFEFSNGFLNFSTEKSVRIPVETRISNGIFRRKIKKFKI